MQFAFFDICGHHPDPINERVVLADKMKIVGKDYWTSKGDTLIYPGNPRTVAVSLEVGL